MQRPGQPPAEAQLRLALLLLALLLLALLRVRCSLRNPSRFGSHFIVSRVHLVCHVHRYLL